MAEDTTNSDSRARLEKAMAELAESRKILEERSSALTQSQTALLQTQVMLSQNLVAMSASLDEYKRDSAARFARIESDINTIMRVLAEHSRLLERLPEAVREKIGFGPRP